MEWKQAKQGMVHRTVSADAADPQTPVLDHRKYLTEALLEAHSASTEGDFPVGALLVDAHGSVLGRSRNTRRTGAGLGFHAEVSLLLSAHEYLRDHQWQVTLYSSLEPCVMCLGAAIISRVLRTVWAANDYWAGGTRSYNFGSPYLQARTCQLVEEPFDDLRLQSQTLVRKHLLERCPSLVELVLRPPSLNTDLDR
jgi:tRNA(adenine34) deaminase